MKHVFPERNLMFAKHDIKYRPYQMNVLHIDGRRPLGYGMTYPASGSWWFRWIIATHFLI